MFFTKQSILWENAGPYTSCWSFIKEKRRKKALTSSNADLEASPPRILSARLIELEREGLIVKQTDDSSLPAVSRYYLTESGGEEFIKVIQEIKKWGGSKWKFSNNECDRSVCKYCDL